MKATEFVQNNLKNFKVYKFHDANLYQSISEIGLSQSEQNVYLVMLAVSDSDGNVQVADSLLAKLGQMSKSSVQRGKKGLINRGVLRLLRKGGSSKSIIVNGVPQTVKEGSTYQLECVVRTTVAKSEEGCHRVPSRGSESTATGSREYCNNNSKTINDQEDKNITNISNEENTDIDHSLDQKVETIEIDDNRTAIVKETIAIEKSKYQYLEDNEGDHWIYPVSIRGADIDMLFFSISSHRTWEDWKDKIRKGRQKLRLDPYFDWSKFNILTRPRAAYSWKDVSYILHTFITKEYTNQSGT